MPTETANERATVRVRAGAKINLFLRIHRRLPTGLHPIEGIFGSLDLADTVDVERRPVAGVSLSTDFPFDCAERDNLCVRAAEAYLARAGGGAGIRLTKEIPVFAVLGGGSSDAAAVLAALNQLDGGRFSPAELAAMAAGLGSDVPYFLSGGLALVRGTGSEVEGLPHLPGFPVLVLKPPVAIATAWAYQAFDAFPDKAGDGDLPGMLGALKAGDIAGVASRLHNSFTPVIEAHHPPVRIAREQLEWAGALGTCLSGSGSAVFGIFGDQAKCDDAWRELSSRGPAWVCALTPRALEMGRRPGEDGA